MPTPYTLVVVLVHVPTTKPNSDRVRPVVILDHSRVAAEIQVRPHRLSGKQDPSRNKKAAKWRLMPLLRQTMEEIETQLDRCHFFRVHRSAIVNIDRVREIHPLFLGDCALVLADGHRIKLSRSRRKDFEALFAKQ